MELSIHQKTPLVLTLTLDQSAQDYFTELRTLYFPAHCNFLDAHLTLFHHLPSANDQIHASLEEVSKRVAFNMQVSGVKSIGNGVAFVIESKELLILHQSLQRLFSAHLISQDKQNLWPHITVQNKVTAFKAKQTFEKLSQAFKPFLITATGMDSWLYLKGPWQHEHRYVFLQP